MLLDSHRDAGRDLQLRLAAYNRARLSPGLPADLDPQGRTGVIDADLVADEARFLLEERLGIVGRAATAPDDAAGFVEWFEELRATGPGQGDPLFPWLADDATLEELRWFLRQEVAGEAGFEDLLALGNLMIALATRREYAYHSVGALGVIELTAPGRSHDVNQALVRLGVSPKARQYFALHATLDKAHSTAWNAEVLLPLVEEQPRVARAIAEGALLRLTAGARCFARYRAELGVRAR